MNLSDDLELTQEQFDQVVGCGHIALKGFEGTSEAAYGVIAFHELQDNGFGAARFERLDVRVDGRKVLIGAGSEYDHETAEHPLDDPPEDHRETWEVELDAIDAWNRSQFAEWPLAEELQALGRLLLDQNPEADPADVWAAVMELGERSA